MCQLFRDFESDRIKLHHNELFTLATTMLNIESGSELFLNILQNNSHYDEPDYDYWVKNLSMMNQKGYNPTRCETFCSYQKICNHGKNIITTVSPHGIEILSNHKEKY